MDAINFMSPSMFGQTSSAALDSSRSADLLTQKARLDQAGSRAGGSQSAFARMLEADPAQDAKLKESCLQMESLLLKQMLTTMRKSVEKSGLIDGGQAEEIFTDMLYDKYAEEMSRSQTLGLSRTIYSQLTGGKKWA